MQENAYDPWGLNLPDLERSAVLPDWWQFSMKERDYRAYDEFEFRHYDATIGRGNAEKLHSQQPIFMNNIMKNIYLLFLLSVLQMLGGIQRTMAQIGNVNHATGTLGVNIPIYTLTEGSLSVPISLEYDGSGVLVEAAASNVGLNWQLNAGGFISREVRGLPDEIVPHQTGSVPKLRGYQEQGYPGDNNFGLFKDYEPDIFTLWLNGNTVRFVIKPSTPFRNQVLLLNDNADLDIEIVNSNSPFPKCDLCNGLEAAICDASGEMDHFVVTAPNGIRYRFGFDPRQREYALTDNIIKSLYNQLFKSTLRPVKWMLSSIEYPKGSDTRSRGGRIDSESFADNPYQKITFDYTRSLQRIESAAYNREFALISAGCNDLPKKTDQNNDVVFLYKSDLKLIESDNVKVYFNHPDLGKPATQIPGNIDLIIPRYSLNTDYKNGYNEYQRQDIKALSGETLLLTQGGCSQSDWPKNSEALNNIVILDKLTSKATGYYLHHEYIKEFNYVLNRSQSGYVDVTMPLPDARLALNGVHPIKFSEGNLLAGSSLLNGYVFSYNEGLLPSKRSLARDHWGYYNGAKPNDVIGIGYSSAALVGAYCPLFVSVNLTPKIETTLIGSLKSVTLPTGGSESYEFELHDSKNFTYDGGQNKVGGLRIKTIRAFEPTSQSESTHRLVYSTKENVNVSSGILAVPPTYTANFGSQTYVHVNAFATMANRFAMARYVTYGEVKEQIEGTSGGKTTKQGFTEYDFYNLENTGLSVRTGPVPTDLSWWYSSAVLAEESIRGFPKSIRHYDSEGILLSEEGLRYDFSDLTTDTDHNLTAGIQIASEYKLDNTNITKTIKVLGIVSAVSAVVPIGQAISFFTGLASTVLSVLNTVLGRNDVTDNSTYRITNYKLPFVRTQLGAHTSVSYDKNGLNPLEVTTKYEYLSPHHKQVTSTKYYRSHDSGNALDELLGETSVVYSRDYKACSNMSSSSSATTGLYFRYMNVPIEIITKRRNRVTSGQFFEYYDKSAEKEGLLKTVHSLELSQPLATFSPASCTVTKNAAYQPTVSITDYNERGLPRVISSTREGSTTTVSYGVNDYLPTSVSYGTGGKTFTTTREYAIPLWGVSKVQGVSGSFTTVTYDDLGRPLLVKDQDGNLVRSYKYKEANPQ